MKNRNIKPFPTAMFLVGLLGLSGCTGIVTYVKSDTRNDNVQCEPDESQIKFGKRSCVIIQQGKTTTNNTSTKATVPTNEASTTQQELDHE
ncbi:hypothetical protein ACW5XW_02880 [Aeromonas piscicola]|uniref:hypothetical protein n=1 Tax=Aeromonas piscicola TaxID=600645 RepID=UPI0005B3E417|nr:hypothetical protein [Aeromonas piscicola]